MSALNPVNLTESGIPAVGTQLAVSNGLSPITYLSLGNQAKINTNTKTDSADTTNQGVDWDQSIPTLKVGGEIGVEIFYIPDSHNTVSLLGHCATDGDTLLGHFLAQTVSGWRLTFPDGKGWFFDAYVLEVPVTSDPTGKALMISTKVKITGAMVPF